MLTAFNLTQASSAVNSSNQLSVLKSPSYTVLYTLVIIVVNTLVQLHTYLRIFDINICKLSTRIGGTPNLLSVTCYGIAS